jgi:hypothetical protein
MPLTERSTNTSRQSILRLWQIGEVAVMQNKDRTRFVEYRKVAKPMMTRNFRLAS